MATMDWFKPGDGNTLKSWGEVEREKARLRRERMIQEAFDRKKNQRNGYIEPESAHQVTGSATQSVYTESRPPSPTPGPKTIAKDEFVVDYMGPANPLQPLPSSRKPSIPQFSWPNYQTTNSSTSSLPSSSKIRGRTLFRFSRKIGRDRALDSNDVIRGKVSPHVSPRTTFKPKTQTRQSVDSAISPIQTRRRSRPHVWLAEARIPIPGLPVLPTLRSRSPKSPKTPTQPTQPPSRDEAPPFDQGIRWSSFFANRNTSKTETSQYFDASPEGLDPLTPDTIEESPTSPGASKRDKLKLIFRRGNGTQHEDPGYTADESSNPSFRSKRSTTRRVLKPLRSKVSLQSRTLFDFPSTTTSTNNLGRRTNNGALGTYRSNMAESGPAGFSRSSAYNDDDRSSVATSRRYGLRKASTRSDSATLRIRENSYLPSRNYSQGTVLESGRLSAPSVDKFGSRHASYSSTDSQHRASVASQGTGSSIHKPTSINIPSFQILSDRNLLSSPFEEHPGSPWDDEAPGLQSRLEGDSDDSSYSNAPPSLNAPPLLPAVYRNLGGLGQRRLSEDESISPRCEVPPSPKSPTTQLIGPLSALNLQSYFPMSGNPDDPQLLTASPSHASANSRSSVASGYNSASSQHYGSSTAATMSTSREKVKEKTKVL
ncbi:hypothetical protein BJ508DRAFT_350618 [Ascobolus immersus RN42]|uniref:Uncharacterized protein n=1 Tax=Ascobolus immersus RN42 TaxID=1160509 RepID=A0A3N4HZQ2_ASCIM|nr:hypothetical protein BJ508DRAFT_350618 [Ascobolus immersus RN42]